MDTINSYIISAVFSFLLGAVPFSYIVAKLYKNIDIRDYGTHNPGAGNVFKVVGWKAGILALIGDIGKGTVSMWIIHAIFDFNPHTLLIFLMFSVFGHIFSPFLQFRGGKGAAVAGGAFLYIVWLKVGFGAVAILALVALPAVLIYFFSPSLVLGLSIVPFVFVFLLYKFGFDGIFIIITSVELLILEIIAIPFIKRDMKELNGIFKKSKLV